ncbi:hypothetical protein [Helicobacter sp. UBA3407]|uniref:hypothetical protein n=1 Tax=Helicobacter sp. UBA3407 TaxID=1946588 RepID=UPI0026289CA2|nr:hypothetical protein [Helicobacter sp. UBA3407]
MKNFLFLLIFIGSLFAQNAQASKPQPKKNPNLQRQLNPKRQTQLQRSTKRLL